MSSHEDSFQVPLPPDQAKALCGHAIASLGLAIKSDLGYGFVCGESFEFGFTWPVTLNVMVNQVTEHMSGITIGGSNFGFGPIQKSHVRNRVSALRQAIEQMAYHRGGSSPNVFAQSSANAPANQGRRKVFVNGVQLRDEEIATLEEKYQSRIPDAFYWYDKMCGAWGMRGGRVLCTIEPDLKLGGDLAADASNGNSGIFINGRELNYLDVALLQRVVPMIIPGRWWLDVYGNFGGERGPMLGNIWELARSQGAEDRSSVLSSWKRSDVAVFSE
jgi:hypothetical protein